jgi:hypothetical protein
MYSSGESVIKIKDYENTFLKVWFRLDEDENTLRKKIIRLKE